MAENAFDACVTDPPYGLAFMGKGWDHSVPGADFWTPTLRVLKPGAYLLAFGGTRTFHRLACAIEDAGFELRDTLMWVYGSGYPKSRNLGDGRGTALKPAWEPIILARKPLVGTVAENAAAWGTGALNIDACRIGEQAGRWPANVLHDGSGEVLAAFPEAPGQLADASSSSSSRKNQNVYGAMRRGRGDEPIADSDNEGDVGFKMKPGARRIDSGSAARFFYCAKADRDDRNEGCENLPSKPLHWSSGDQNPGSFQSEGTDKTAKNHHPTVKPTALMRYLCRLVTPAGGIVLDPFMGSGSTGKGAVLEGYSFHGIELDAEYAAISRARINATFPLMELVSA